MWYSDKSKVAFAALACGMWAVNAWMAREEYSALSDQIAAGLGTTIFSIFVWSIVGYALAGVWSFFHNVVRPGEGSLTTWQKVDLGLIAGIILKPWFGLGF